MSFCNRLKELRTEKHLTQRELANQMRLTANSICEWEKGRSQPGIEQLKKLSFIFECSIDYLTANSDDLGIISFQSNNATVTTEEQTLLENYRSLPRQEKAQASEYIQFLASKRGNQNKNA